MSSLFSPAHWTQWEDKKQMLCILGGHNGYCFHPTVGCSWSIPEILLTIDLKLLIHMFTWIPVFPLSCWKKNPGRMIWLPLSTLDTSIGLLYTGNKNNYRECSFISTCSGTVIKGIGLILGPRLVKYQVYALIRIIQLSLWVYSHPICPIRGLSAAWQCLPFYPGSEERNTQNDSALLSPRLGANFSFSTTLFR